jgi:hypothetical protein
MLPLKINTDLDPTNAPENSSTLNVNMNADILKGVISNEQGFDIITLTNDSRKIIGSCLLPDNSTCLFSQIFNNANYASEIGVVKEGVYTVILRDNLPANAALGFNTTNLIQAQSKVNFNGDFVVYWVDDNNSDKWLNITNLQVDTTTDLKITDAAQFNLMLGFAPAIGDLPDQSTTVIEAGSLFSGVYYISLVYGDKFQNFTKAAFVSSPIPVVQSSGPFDNQYIGSIANTATNKAISINLNFASINPEYDFIKVYVISKINQVFKAYEFGVFSISNTDFNCIIDTLTNKTEVSLDSIIINNADYNSSLTLTQLDDVLYKAHLRNRETIDLQPYVNNIKVNYVQKEIELADTFGTNTDTNFRNPNLCFYSKGFTYDEVYALYVSFTIDDNGEYETQAYHIPGRIAAEINLNGTTIPLENNLIDDLAITDYDLNYDLTNNKPFSQFLTIDSNNSKVFHAIATNDNPLADTNMGYWENRDEIYSNTNKWITLDATSTPIPGKDFQGQNVRHHKFPEAYNHDITTLTPNLPKSIHPSNTNYNVVNLLGIKLSDVVIPDELVSKVKKINIYYAKRDLNNRTVLGQALLQSLSQIHNSDNAAYNTQNQVFNNGGAFVGYQMLQDFAGDSQRKAGIFPVGYQRTTLQAYAPWTLFSTTGPWMYSDNNGIEPTFWGKGYYKFKSFDLMNQNISVDSAVYIKNLYRVKSLYKGLMLGGDLSNADSNWYTGMLFDPANATNSEPIRGSYYGGIDRLVNNSEGLQNYIRIVTNKSYVTKNFPNQREKVDSSPYPFFGIPYNYQGETGIWLETDYYLYSWKLAANFREQGNDFPYVDYYGDGSSPNGFQRSNNLGNYVSPYISNLCAFKINLFQIFDNQVLCLANSINIEDIDITEIYNGDTFTSIYADKGSIDLATWSPQGSPTEPIDNRPQNRISSVHCYIAQSTSNPNYRYEGDNSWETFYPYTDFTTMANLSPNDPEWFGYNIDYSAVNDLKQPVIASNFDNQLQDYFPNRVIRSAKDNPEIQQDNYLDYQAGDYKDFGKIKGKIRNITNQNNKLLIKTDNALYATLGREVISTENAEANVTAGDIFAVKPREIVSSDSYGGGLGRFADTVTQYGYMYPDTTNGIVYNFNGQSVDEISKAGRQIFFRNELKFKLPKLLDNYVFSKFPAYSSVATYIENYYVTFNGKVWVSLTDGTLGTPGQSEDWQLVDYNFTRIDSIVDPYSIGVQATFDYKYRRYILTKKDYTFNTVSGIFGFVGNIPDMLFANTITNGVTKAWYNGYIYTLYVVGDTPAPPANAEYLVTRGLYGIYGVKTDFNSIFNLDSFVTAYYPELQAWVSMYDFGGVPEFMTYTIDKTYSFNGNTLFKHNSDTQNTLFYDRETPYTSFVEPILNTPQGVKRFSSFSFITELFRANGTLDYLKTFTNYFVRNSYQISDKIEVVNTKTSRNAEGYFNANEFRDLTRDNSKPLMTDAIIHQPDLANINVNKHWSKQKKFVDYYLIPRLEYTPELLTGTTLTIDSLTYTLDGVLENDTIIKFIYLGVTYVYQLTKVEPFGDNTSVVTIGYVVSLNNTPVLNSILTIPSFEYTFKRTLDLFDINTLTHKNTR